MNNSRWIALGEQLWLNKIGLVNWVKRLRYDDRSALLIKLKSCRTAFKRSSQAKHHQTVQNLALSSLSRYFVGTENTNSGHFSELTKIWTKKKTRFIFNCDTNAFSRINMFHYQPHKQREFNGSALLFCVGGWVVCIVYMHMLQ